MVTLPIKNYENYRICSEGYVINSKGHKLKYDYSGKSKSYKRITLCKNGIAKRHLIHRLVAEHFIKNPFNKIQVNHKDFNQGNNNVYNLEWVTPEENWAHAVKEGKTGGCSFIKFGDEEIPKLFKMKKEGLNNVQIAKKYNVTRECIRDILLGKKRKNYKRGEVHYGEI